MRALIVDPGKRTGFGYLTWEPGDLDSPAFEGSEMFHFEFLTWAEPVVRNQHVDLVVCESFSIRRDTQQTVGGDRLWSVEQIGNLRYWCGTLGMPYVQQTPSDMKSFDQKKAKTKILGWWAEPRGSGFAGHRRDAASHALLYAVRNQLIDPRRLLP